MKNCPSCGGPWNGAAHAHSTDCKAANDVNRKKRDPAPIFGRITKHGIVVLNEVTQMPTDDIAEIEQLVKEKLPVEAVTKGSDRCASGYYAGTSKAAH